tara:strand:- start:374 stop:577 length:204 start_codon:yes stop_codon:yes gene_type:complete
MSNQTNTDTAELLMAFAKRLDDLLMRVETLEATLRANQIQVPELPAPVGQTNLNQFVPTGDVDFPRL